MEIIFFVFVLVGIFLGPTIRDTWIGCHCHGCMEEKRQKKALAVRTEAKVGEIMPKLDDTLYTVVKREYFVPLLLKWKRNMVDERAGK